MAHRAVSRTAGGLLAAGLLLHAAPAWAPFHLLVIEEVFFGSEDCPDAQYVKLRTEVAGQAFVQSQSVTTLNADGSEAGTFGRFSAPAPNGQAGVAIIMGTEAAQGYFDLTMDEVVTGRLRFPDGGLCFGLFGSNPVDCVAYGDFTGPGEQPAETPVRGMALFRTADTGNDRADFELRAPSPENNAGETGTPGTCPDVEPTPVPTPTATVMPVDSDCVGDCNGDNTVAVNELITGVGINLGNNDVSSCPAMDANDDLLVAVNELISAVGNNLNGCPEPSGPLGVRRFSVDPGSSPLVTHLEENFTFSAFPGFDGFLELEAGEPDADGIARIDLVDASDFIAIDIAAGGTVLCFEPARDRFPVIGVGFVDCDGGSMAGLRTFQDHVLGTVGVDGFTEQDCLDAGGTVEGAGGQHPGVCNGPISAEPLPEDSGPGAVLLSPDEDAGYVGIPMRLLTETALPCGDEGVSGEIIDFAFTSGDVVIEVLDRNAEPGNTFSFTQAGEGFDCSAWTEEDGPGQLSFGAPNLHTAALGEPADILTVFVWAD